MLLKLLNFTLCLLYIPRHHAHWTSCPANAEI